MIYSNAQFGYEGQLVKVEVDLRSGIPAMDIVGLSDSVIRETRERVRSAIKNSGFAFPFASERTLISLSPVDLQKEEKCFDLPIALAMLSESFRLKTDIDVIALGELKLSGNVTSVRNVFSSLLNARMSGIKHAIVPMETEVLPDGIVVHKVSNLKEAFDVFKNIQMGSDNGWGKEYNDINNMDITFTDIGTDFHLDQLEGHNGAKYAMAVAAAGRHNLLFVGSPGCGKTMFLHRMPEIMPDLTDEERVSTQRIWSLSGLLRGSDKMKARPFRTPHQTASIEGICGGGPQCRAGEISLAHNGILFLDEAAEFRSSVLQMLRVPLESHTITLSRAGRQTVFPADFQLLMATNPCPCGNYGSREKICLCSAKSVEQYWRKFGAPLLDRVDIMYDFNNEVCNSGEVMTLGRMRFLIKRAWERQYKRQGMLNSRLGPEGIARYCQLMPETQQKLDDAIIRYNYSPRTISSILRVARTIHDMFDEEESELIGNIDTAIDLHGKLPLGYSF